MKNASDGLSRLDMAAERISEFEDISLEASKAEKEKTGRKIHTHTRTHKNLGTTTKGIIYVKWNTK